MASIRSTSNHMVAQASIAAALEAGCDEARINGVLKQIAADTVFDEFWVSVEDGGIEFTNMTEWTSPSRRTPEPTPMTRLSPSSWTTRKRRWPKNR